MNIQRISRKLNDREFRTALRANPELVSEIGYDYNSSVRYVIKTNSRNTLYVPIDQPSVSDLDLHHIQAAGGCAGSAGSIGCISSFCTTFGTIGSAGTAGTHGD